MIRIVLQERKRAWDAPRWIFFDLVEDFHDGQRLSIGEYNLQGTEKFTEVGSVNLLGVLTNLLCQRISFLCSKYLPSNTVE